MSSITPLPKGTKKVFLAYLDSYFGAQCIATLVSMGIEVSGIVRDPQSISSLHPSVKKVFHRHEVEGIRQSLLAHDFIIYNTPQSAQEAYKAIHFLSTSHFEFEKRFLLLSTTMSWFETLPIGADPSSEEAPPITEDQFNRRVPHVKYHSWRDVEKFVSGSNTERLKTFVVFSGLMYGAGEEMLLPLFRQAWTLAAEGLPIFGSGQQTVPMIHVKDCASFVSRLITSDQLIPANPRYFFAADEGNCTWQNIVDAINQEMGNGKMFVVPTREFGLYENIEHFIVDLKIEAAQIGATMSSDIDAMTKGGQSIGWHAHEGFVQSIAATCAEFRRRWHVDPLRVLLTGPPSAGKSFSARSLASHYKLPYFSIADIIAEYKVQEAELLEELQRRRASLITEKRNVLLEEKCRAAIDEIRQRMEEAAEERAGGRQQGDGDSGDEEEEEDGGMDRNPSSFKEDGVVDEDDVFDEDDVEPPELTAEEEQAIVEFVAENDEDGFEENILRQIAEIKKVLAMRISTVAVETDEPPNPKEKKKVAAAKAGASAAGGGGKKGKGNQPIAEEKKEDVAEAPFSDRALALMVQWRLSRAECRNQGYILDGFPKTIRQARLVFEDTQLEVPDDPENEPDFPLDPEEKELSSILAPNFVIHLRGSDTFLLDRLLLTQSEHPHNNTIDFQRRLEGYKTNFDIPRGLLQYLESARTEKGGTIHVHSLGVEELGALHVPPPPPASSYAKKEIDVVTKAAIDLIGEPRNFGPTPADVKAEKERLRMLMAEQRANEAARRQEQFAREAADIAALEKLKNDEKAKFDAMRNSERALLEQRKMPLKSFLMSHVTPILTKGLVEVCKKRPDDPVDFLAEWLFKHNPEDHPELYS